MEVLTGRIYKHYKGDYYLVEAIAIHTETDDKMVIYRSLYGSGALYVRPYNLFIEKVNGVHRFELQDIESVKK